MSTLERAIQIAVEAHKGRLDKGGSPYILHPLRLMLRMNSCTAQMVAVLHDVVEDSSWTCADLEHEGFPAKVVQAVQCLTRRDAESYEDFVRRVAQNPLARQVKLVDLEDNMDPRRLGQLTERDVERIQKYHQAWVVLQGREDPGDL